MGDGVEYVRKASLNGFFCPSRAVCRALDLATISNCNPQSSAVMGNFLKLICIGIGRGLFSPGNTVGRGLDLPSRPNCNPQSCAVMGDPAEPICKAGVRRALSPGETRAPNLIISFRLAMDLAVACSGMHHVVSRVKGKRANACTRGIVAQQPLRAIISVTAGGGVTAKYFAASPSASV